MPLKADQLPPNSRTLWETVRRIQRDLKELRAARTLEQATIGSGGLTVQDPTTTRTMRFAANGPVAVTAPSGTYYPPEIVFSAGDGSEVNPGIVAAYTAPNGVAQPIPTWLVMTPDLGNGASYVKLQAATSTDPTTAAMAVTVGTGSLILGPGAFYVTAGGLTLVFGASGLALSGETVQTMTLLNGWTAFGSTYGAPAWQKKSDGTLQLMGVAKPGTLTAGTVVASLGASYAPSADRPLKLSAGSSTASADVYLRSGTGNIEIQNVSGTPTWLSFDGHRIQL